MIPIVSSLDGIEIFREKATYHDIEDGRIVDRQKRPRISREQIIIGDYRGPWYSQISTGKGAAVVDGRLAYAALSEEGEVVVNYFGQEILGFSSLPAVFEMAGRLVAVGEHADGLRHVLIEHEFGPGFERIARAPEAFGNEIFYIGQGRGDMQVGVLGGAPGVRYRAIEKLAYLGEWLFYVGNTDNGRQVPNIDNTPGRPVYVVRGYPKLQSRGLVYLAQTFEETDALFLGLEVIAEHKRRSGHTSAIEDFCVVGDRIVYILDVELMRDRVFVDGRLLDTDFSRIAKDSFRIINDEVAFLAVPHDPRFDLHNFPEEADYRVILGGQVTEHRELGLVVS